VNGCDVDALVVRVQAGDESAFAELYRRCFDRVYGLLRVLLRDPHEAEDLTQQVFINAHEAIGGYEARGRPFEAWLLAIARNQAISHLRRSRPTDLEDPAELDQRRERDPGNGDSLRTLRWISDQDLLLLIERLPPEQRQVLVLRYMLDHAPREIAELLDISPNHVSVLQYRALSFLRARLRALGRDAADLRPSPLRRAVPQARVLRRRRFALTP
jgi:RNA polymerase sigma-70 factor (ECF subfamily)